MINGLVTLRSKFHTKAEGKISSNVRSILVESVEEILSLANEFRDIFKTDFRWERGGNR